MHSHTKQAKIDFPTCSTCLSASKLAHYCIYQEWWYSSLYQLKNRKHVYSKLIYESLRKCYQWVFKTHSYITHVQKCQRMKGMRASEYSQSCSRGAFICLPYAVKIEKKVSQVTWVSSKLLLFVCSQTNYSDDSWQKILPSEEMVPPRKRHIYTDLKCHFYQYLLIIRFYF